MARRRKRQPGGAVFYLCGHTGQDWDEPPDTPSNFYIYVLPASDRERLTAAVRACGLNGPYRDLPPELLDELARLDEETRGRLRK